jgi:hypothetical protein
MIHRRASPYTHTTPQQLSTLKLTPFFAGCYCRYTRRGSSVVEQPIRNRQVASSTLALGSIFSLRLSVLAPSLNRPHRIRCKVVASLEFFGQCVERVYL